MEVSLQKTLIFLLFIGIGLLLKVKFRNKDEISGIKKIILNLALPATIFIALLSIELKPGLLLLPFFALLLNAILFFLFPYLLPLCGLKKGSPGFRTAAILVPSLAPGLSSFPFILEYLGDSSLAKAAMADLGNKVFVLLILYMIALNWHYKVTSRPAISNGARLKDLLKALFYEPVNLFIIIAILLVSFNVNLERLPVIVAEIIKRLSYLMTPLVLLFIGLAVSIQKKQFSKIFSLLLLRAGVVILIGSLFIWIGGIGSAVDRLFILAFSLSACSFWPYAHIAVVGLRESEDSPDSPKTFSGKMAINILALSFPMSILFILGLFSIGEGVAELKILLPLSLILIFFGILSGLLKRRSTSEKFSEVKKITPEFENAGAENF